MHLVWFPLNSISCTFILFVFLYAFVRNFSVDRFWMILMWLAFDIWGATRSEGGVVYWGHIGGLFCGFCLALTMTYFRWVETKSMERSLLETWKVKCKTRTKTPSPTMHPTEDNRNFRGNEWQTIPLPPALLKSKQTDNSDQEREKPTSSRQSFIYFECPCEKSLKIIIEHASKTGRCPQCNSKFKVPSSQG